MMKHAPPNLSISDEAFLRLSVFPAPKQSGLRGHISADVGSGVGRRDARAVDSATDGDGHRNPAGISRLDRNISSV
jgi:hypothetical protein